MTDEGRTRTNLPDGLPPTPASDTQTGDAWAIGRVFGRYRLEGLLGTGGFGEVFLATDLKLKRQVAIKTLLPRHAANLELRSRFIKEAEVLAALESPGIVRILELGEEDLGGRPWFAMEYVDRARPLNRLLDEGWAPSPREAAGLVAAFARALSHVHAKGYIHRDVKPGNVLVSDGGEVKLIDLGIAKEEDASLGFTGTPAYQAPEVVSAGAFSPASDVYALGVVLYELLVNRHTPWGETSRYEYLTGLRSRHYLRPRVLDPRIPADLEEVVIKAVERDLLERYRSAAALADDLEAWLDGRVPVAAGVGAASRVLRTGRKTVRRHKLAVGVIAASLAVLLAVGAWAWARESRREIEQQARDAADQARAMAERTFMEAGERGATSGERAEVQQAIATYTRALESDPDHVRARYYRGRALQRLGQHEESLRDLQLVVSTQEGNIEAQYYLAKALLLAGAETGRVLGALARVQALDPGGTFGGLARLQSLLLSPPTVEGSGTIDHASLKSAIQAVLSGIRGDHADLHLYRAMEYTGFEAWQLARDRQVFPEYFRFWISDRYQPDEVEKNLELCVKADPLVYVAWQGLGELLANRDDNEGALACLDRALLIHPQHLASLRFRGMVRWMTRDTAGALDDFDKALGLVTPEVHDDLRDRRLYQLATFLALDSGRMDLARRFYEGPANAFDGAGDAERVATAVFQICIAYAIFDGKPDPALVDELQALGRKIQSELAGITLMFRITRSQGIGKADFTDVLRLMSLEPKRKLRLRPFLDRLVQSGTIASLDQLHSQDPTRVRLYEQLFAFFNFATESDRPWWKNFRDGFRSVVPDVPFEFLIMVWKFALERAQGTVFERYGHTRNQKQRITLAHHLYIEKKPAQAVKMLQSAIADQPDNAELHYNLACCLALTGDQDGTIRELRVAGNYGWEHLDWARDDPDFANVHELPDFKALMAGPGGRDILDELDTFRRLAERGDLPGRPPVEPGPARDLSAVRDELLRRAVDAHRKRNFIEAEEAASAAIGYDIRDARAWYVRGLVRFEGLGEDANAIADYSQALALQPGVPLIHRARGFARHHAGDLPGAVQDWRDAVQQDPRLARELEPWIRKVQEGR